MFKKILFLFVLCFLIFIKTALASEIPFEVFKEKVSIEDKEELENRELSIKDGKLIDPSTVENDLFKLTRVPITAINYKIDFWNVGEMEGKKGFIFTTDYGKAKLEISYETGQAYKMQKTGKKFGNLELSERVDLDTPDIDNLEYDLIFTGGPYGKFWYEDPVKKERILIAEIDEGRFVHIMDIPDTQVLIHPDIYIKIPDSAFSKWLEVLEQNPTCQDPSDPETDSGVRFNMINGEVSITPCNDEDSTYYAEYNMVLHRNDIIRTGDDSTAELALSDLTHFYLAPNSAVVLNYTPEKRNLFKIIAGKIKANVKHMLDDGSIEVDMSEAVAGIKGTTFVVEENGKESTLKVIEGQVEFKSKNDDKVEMVNTGEKLSANSESLLEKENFDIEKENEYWEKILKANNNYLKYILFFAVFLIILILGYLYIKSRKKSN